MTDTRIADIRKTLDHIRNDVLEPGYVVDAETTLRTCPADLNRIGWKLDEIEKALAVEPDPLEARVAELEAPVELLVAAADEAIREAEDALDEAVDDLPSDGIKRVTIGPLGEFAVDRFRDHRGESWEEFAQAIVDEAVALNIVARIEQAKGGQGE